MSLQSKGLSRVFSNTTVQEHQFFDSRLSLQSNSHIHTWLLEKTIALTRQTFVGKVMSLLFNMLSRLVITFLPRSMRLLISWLQSPSAVKFGPHPSIKLLNCYYLMIYYSQNSLPFTHIRQYTNITQEWALKFAVVLKSLIINNVKFHF